MNAHLRAPPDDAPRRKVVIDLPFPPSVNRIWRSGKGKRGNKPRFYLEPKYEAWKKECDGLLMESNPRPRPIVGPFDICLHFDERRRRSNTDIDNRIKAVLDWLQRVKLIENDALANSVAAFWADTSDGCTVVLFGERL